MKRKITLVILTSLLISTSNVAVFITRDIDAYLVPLKKLKQTKTTESKAKISQLNTKKSKLLEENKKLTLETQELKNKVIQKSKELEKTGKEIKKLTETIVMPLAPPVISALKNIQGLDIQDLFGDIRTIFKVLKDGIVYLSMKKIMKVLVFMIEKKYMEAQELRVDIAKIICQIGKNESMLRYNKENIKRIDLNIKKIEATLTATIKKIDDIIRQVTKEKRYDLDIRINKEKNEIANLKKEFETTKEQLDAENKKLETEISRLEKEITKVTAEKKEVDTKITHVGISMKNEALELFKKTKKYLETELALKTAVTAISAAIKVLKIGLSTIPEPIVTKAIAVGLATQLMVLKGIYKSIQLTHRATLVARITGDKDNPNIEEIQLSLANILELHGQAMKLICNIESNNLTIKEQLNPLIQENKTIINDLFKEVEESYEKALASYLLKEQLIRAELKTVSIVQKGLDTPHQKEITTRLKNTINEKNALQKEITTLRKKMKIKG